MKKQLSLIMMALFAFIVGAWADADGAQAPKKASSPEAYVEYTEDSDNWGSGVLTFYYDTERSSRPGTTYDLNVEDNTPDWQYLMQEVYKVVFKPSFADARPTSTYRWFCCTEYNDDGWTISSTLLKIEGMQYLNTSMVENMASMFEGCYILKDGQLDFSHFDTSKVVDMNSMFYYCDKLTVLDLSTFDTSKVMDTSYMFTDSSNLTTISVGDGWSMESNGYSDDMFYYCTSLVGGAGTTYDENHTDASYAHVDGGSSNPGYLTDGGGEAEPYGIIVGDVEVTTRNANHITGSSISGNVSYDHATHTLTLDNATIQGRIVASNQGNIVYSGTEFIINLVGKNRINSNNTQTENNILAVRTTKITGTGSLECESSILVHFGSKLIIEGGCRVYSFRGILGQNGGETLVLRGQNTVVKTDLYSIYWFDSVTMEDGLKVIIPEGGYYDTSQKYLVDADGNRASRVKIASKPWPYHIRVGSVDVTAANAENVTGDYITGNVSYDMDTFTLTLDNVTLADSGSGGGIVVYKEDGGDNTLTLHLIGENEVKGAGIGVSVSGPPAFVITGNGSLLSPGGVNVYSNLTIGGGCKIHTNYLTADDEATIGLTVSGAETEIHAKYLYGFSSLTLNDGLTIAEPQGAYFDEAKKMVCDKDGNKAQGVVIKKLITYDLWVCGEQVTEANCSDIMGDGHVSYDEATNTLTLDNATINNDASDTDAASQYGKALVTNIPGLKVVVNGKTNITSSHNTAVTFQGDVTLCGSGTLTATAPTSLFVAQNSTLTVNGGVRLIAHGTVYYGIIGSLKPPSGTPTSNLVVEGANTEVRAYGPYGSIIRLESFSLNDGLVLNEPEGAHFEGMHVYDGEGNIVQKQWVVISKPYEAYDLWIDGRQVNEHNRFNIDGDNVFAYDLNNKKLTVNGDYTATNGSVIESLIENLTIEFKKNVTLTTTKEGCAAIKATGNTSLRGTGTNTVTLVGTGYGIKMDNGSLTFSLLNAEVSGHHALEGITSNYSCSLGVYNSGLTATATDGEPAIFGFRDGILLSGCEITEPAGGQISNGQILDSNGLAASHVVIGRQSNYALYIDDKTVSASNCDDILGNGLFSFDPNTVTLTVKGSYTTTKEHLIWNRIYGLVIDVVADAELKSSGAVLYLENVTTLTGNGQLSLTSEQKGIETTTSALFTIENANLFVSGKYGLSGNSSKDSKLLVKNSRVQVEATMRAIYDFHGGIELENCAITLPDGGKVSNGEVVNSKGNTAKKVTIEPTGPATDINIQQLTPNTQDWYTIGGQKLNAKPTRSGIYICNGHKIVIK